MEKILLEHMSINLTRRNLLLWWFWTFVFQIGIAQPDSLFTLHGDQGIPSLRHWVDHTNRSDSTLFLQQLHTMELHYKKKKEKTLERFIWLAAIRYRATHLYPKDGKPVDIYLKAIEEATVRKWYSTEGELHVHMGVYLSDHRRWGPAFEHFLKAHHLLSTYGYAQHPHTRDNLYEIGLVFYHAGEYRSAISFIRRCINYWPSLVKEKEGFTVLNTLALTYKRENIPDSAIYYFNLAHQNALENNNVYWAMLIHGNLGHLYYEQQKYDEALPLMLEDYHGSLEHGIRGAAMNAAVTLASIYLMRNDLQTAETFLDEAKKLEPFVVHPISVTYYDIRYNLNRKKGNLAAAVAYADSFRIKQDSLQRSKNLTALDQATLKFEVERHANEIKHLEDARKRQVILRNTLLVILAMSAFIMFQFYQRKIYKRNKELQLASLNEKIALAELENAKKDLDLYTRNLKEKNELLDAIRLEMEVLRVSGTQQMDERTERLNQLLHSTILTESDWNDFRGMFEKVYPGFFTRLKQTMPDLTPADTRLLALTKLNLSSKEMASILGISSDSIKKSRQRLRRRLHLPEEGSLDELIEEV